MYAISTKRKPPKIWLHISGWVRVRIITLTSHKCHGVSNNRQLDRWLINLFRLTARKQTTPPKKEKHQISTRLFRVKPSEKKCTCVYRVMWYDHRWCRYQHVILTLDFTIIPQILREYFPRKNNVICVNMLTHWGRDKMAASFLTTFSNAFSWQKML